MTFTSDDFTPSDTPSDRSTPEEPIHNTYRYHQDPQETPDQTQTLQKMQQSLEPQKNRRKKGKPIARKTTRSRSPVPNPNSNNEYSPILCLGFTLIKFLFFSIAGFIIAYIFTSFAHAPTATILWNVGSMLIIPLVGLVFCIVAIVIFLESCR